MVFDGDAILGTGMDYATHWETYFDSESGIVCIGDPTITEQTQNIEFTHHTIASITNQELVAVWIKPKFLT